MSELPDNWVEIRNDKFFWDEVKRMILADELDEVRCYENAVRRLTSGLNTKFVDEKYSAEEYDYDLHEIAIAAVINSHEVFRVFYEDQYGQDASSTVNELAGRYYVANWSDPTMVIGPNDTIEDAASVILSCYDDGTFTHATSNLPILRVLEFCAQAVPVGGYFKINDINYVMTKDGLVSV